MSNVLIEGRYVVCAAIRSEDLVITGVRHYCPLMTAVIQKIEESGFAKHKYNFRKAEQGFVDQFGVFMDRKEALAVAREAGQLNTRTSKTAPEHLLFSEDLY